MADHHHHHSLLGLGSVGKACKSFVLKCYHEKILSPRKAQTKNEPKIEDKIKDKKILEEIDIKGIDKIRQSDEVSPRAIAENPSYPKNLPSPSPPCSPRLSRTTSPLPARSSNPSPLSRSASKRSQTPTRPNPRTNSLLRTLSTRTNVDHGVTNNTSLSKSVSRRGSTAIMYSNSNGIMKPPAMEKILECTLEELCFGCVRIISITRDAVTNDGDVIEEDEVLTIKVKPGWRKGTKITFEGMGNKTPGALPADVVFTVAEKHHPLYRREGDDLELAVAVPLVKALTACSLPIPLLSGEMMNLTLEDIIIYPGYKSIIPGEGMPSPQDQTKRGNLIITFLVEFPTQLTDAQRNDLVNILQGSSFNQ